MERKLSTVGNDVPGERPQKREERTREGYRELIPGYVRYERLHGKRSIRKLPYLLTPFFRYLEQEGLELADIDYRRAQEFQTYLVTLEDASGETHYATSSVLDIMYTVRNFYRYLKQQGDLMSNPFESVSSIRQGEPLPRGLPDEKRMNELLEKLRCFWNHPHLRGRKTLYKLHVMVEVLYATGLRISELANLTCDDVDWQTRVVRVRDGKGGKDRRAYVSEYAAAVLRHYIVGMREWVNARPRSSRLFGVKDGRNLDAMLNTRLKAVGRQCGLEQFTSHAVRHTLGFHLLRRGCDLRYIQLILGHEDMASTSLYTKVEKQDLRRELDRCHPRTFRKGP